jgi:hypothetical protein
MRKILLIITFLFSLCATAQIYVDASATGANDGTSWTDAYTDINTALNDTASNDFWVAAGVYKPESTNNSSIDLNTDQKLYGGFSGTEVALSQRDFRTNTTILSGDQLGNDLNNGLTYDMPERSDNNYRVIRVVGLGVIVDGFTIQDGSAEGVASTLKEGAAGILNNDTIIRNCVIKNNVAERGGAFVASQSNINGTVIIENSIIQNNLASFAPAFYAYSNLGQTIRFVNVQFTENTSGNAVGQTGFGGVIWLRFQNAAVSMQMINCTISDNDYQNSSGSNVLSNIRVQSAGTGQYLLRNSIFWNNGTNYKVLHNQSGSSSFLIDDNIDADDFSNISSATNTIISDPIFTDPVNDDYTITANSPAVESGTNSHYAGNLPFEDYLGNQRIQGSVIDLGCYESPFSNAAAPVVVYVDPMATGNNDGSSWQDAFISLQTALNNNTSSDLWIAAGTYTPGASRTSRFEIRGTNNLYGGFNGTETQLFERDPSVNVTILSGDINGNDSGNVAENNTTYSDNALHVVRVLGSGSSIDGITIKGGFANGSTTIDQEGASIQVTERISRFSINDCIVEGNFCIRGGALQANNLISLRLNIDRTVFTNNVARFGPAIYTTNKTGNPTVTLNVTNSQFDNNRAVDTSNGAALGSIIWNRAEFAGNVAATYTGCTFADNTVPASASNNSFIILGSANGGNSSLEIENTIFWDNTRGTNDMIFPVISDETNNRFVAVSNSLSPDNFSNQTSKVSTIQSDPLFVTSSSNIYELGANSPAMNSGNNSFVDAIYNVDIIGNDRIAGTNVDMGAYEFGSTAGINDEVVAMTIKLYPNPVSDLLNVMVENFAFAKAYLYNLQGQQILTTTESSINVSELKTGLYLIKIQSENGTIATERFIKR